MRQLRFDSRLLHASEPSPRPDGAIVQPIYTSSTYEHGPDADYHDVRYIRLNNTPNHIALHATLATLEEAEAALVTASGMAAISTTLLSLLRTGDHLIAQENLYGGTHAFVTSDLARLGIRCTLVDSAQPDTWAAALEPTTRAIYVETLSNPLLRVPDLPAVVDFARAHGLVSLVDNTFASPVLYQPATQGFDLSLHSATKYLNGHTDLVAGAVIGRSDLVREVKTRLDHFGGCLDPHAAWMLQRGMKTLGLRVRRQCASAHEVALYLQGHPAVERVYYPGLTDHPGHDRARTSLAAFGGMLSFELRAGVTAAERFLRSTTLAACAPSLGGVETLVTRPATTSHAGMSPAERAQRGIAEGLVRVSVGIEDVADLIDDFDRALMQAVA